MIGKRRHISAIHEAGHAVIARKLGCSVTHVSAVRGHALAETASAEHLAAELDVSSQLDACEKDAIVALAGLAANRREQPNFRILDLFTDTSGDMVNARSAIYRMACLQTGQPMLDPGGTFTLAIDPTTGQVMEEIYIRLVQKTRDLVAQHWSIIERVAKHLKNHTLIDQTELDDLIQRAESSSQAAQRRPD